MNKNIKIIIGIVVVAVVVITGYSILGDEQKETGPAKIGFIAPITGFAAVYGETMQNVAEIALEELSSDEENTPAEFIFEDSQGDPKQAVTAAQKLINIDKVDALVVLLGNDIAAVEPIANQNKIPLLGVGAVSLKVPSEDDYLFTGLVSPKIRGGVSANYVIDSLDNPTIAVMSNLENDLGLAWLAGFKERYSERDMNDRILIEETSAGFTNTDFRTQLAKIKQTGAEYIVTTTVFSDTPFLLKQAGEIGVEAKFFGTADLENDQLVENAGVFAEGVIFNGAQFDPDNLTPYGKSVESIIKAGLGVDTVGLLEGAFWDSSVTILQAIEKGGGTPEGILKGLKKVKMDGFLGGIAFDRDGNMRPRGDTFKVIQNGEFVIVDRVE